ncbi:MAG: outer membrane protein assembly factor BamC [Methylomonas sp.]
MRKTTALTLPCLSLLLVACADSPDKYRDIKHLEMPPTLAIERNTSTPVKSSRSSSTTSTANTSETNSKPASDLDKLIYLAGDDQHPVLQLKTRFERGWDLINHGLQLADIEVIDKNHDEGKIRVRYVADQASKGRGFVSSVTSFFTDKFADTEYTLTLDKDSRITGVHIDKVTSGENDAESFNNNDAKALATLLQKTIKTDLEK